MADGAVDDSQQGSPPSSRSDILQRKCLPPGKSYDAVNEIKTKPVHKVRHVSRLDALISRKSQSRTGRCSIKDIDTDLQPCLEDILRLFNERNSNGNFKLEGGSAVETKAYDAIIEELAS